jgi:2'-5' RNA ligase
MVKSTRARHAAGSGTHEQVRLFVAITPSVMALGELERVVAPLRASRPELRWASPESWHVTLAFLGEVSEKAVPRLETKLGNAAAKHHALGLQTASGGAFPSVPKARVLWTGLDGDLEALANIAQSVDEAARHAKVLPPDAGRRFRPHITLARCKEPVDVSDLVDSLKAHTGCPWTADRIHLIRSYLGPNQHYESLGSWSLKARAGDGVGSQA